MTHSNSVLSASTPSGAESVTTASPASPPAGDAVVTSCSATGGLAARSDCTETVDPRIEAMICELEKRGFFVSEMKTTTLRTSASNSDASDITNSTSVSRA